ncbi:unnamed protein product [Clonostachys rosea]|uniref:Non-specific serine/threonine protein kinase n=1 Tax=Bionectria ochroleuca TaxID=29856 RepID=A0ABY6V120_BIOOC|nr:unnamed protein product [Clonostachys rosea]
MENIPPCYSSGQLLTLQVGADHEPFSVLIVSAHGKWTNSVNLLVKVLPNDSNIEFNAQLVFLKLYDRRFAPAFRERWDVEPWTPTLEEHLFEFSHTGEARDVLDAWRDNPYTEYDFSAPDYHKEAVISEIMTEEFEKESEAYSVLEDHQGEYIPRIMASVFMQIGPAGIIGERPIPLLDDPLILGKSCEMFEVQGLLMEYYPGFPATKIDCQTDPGDWQHLKNRCINLVGHVMKSDQILHEDIRPKNVVITRDENYLRSYRVIMTDFRSTMMRGTENDEEWADMKKRYDEKGMMQAKLENPPRRRGNGNPPQGSGSSTASAWWNFDGYDVMTQE